MLVSLCALDAIALVLLGLLFKKRKNCSFNVFLWHRILFSKDALCGTYQGQHFVNEGLKGEGRHKSVLKTMFKKCSTKHFDYL